MENSEGNKEFNPNIFNAYPVYLYKETQSFEKHKLAGFMRCYDCQGNVPLDQADSYMCRKVYQSIYRLANKGWLDTDILKEIKRIYGNDIIYRHYEAPSPTIVKFI
jgi:cytochrome c-type biogenesis protein CcmH/NrfF